VRSRAAAWIEQQRRARLPLAVLVVPLLIESGMTAQVDYVVVIAASAATRTARLTASRGWHKEEISRRMAAQLSDAERRQYADCVVCNEGTRAQFAQALRNALQEAERHERRPSS
jgi:dephospho-CoA kinase